MFLLVLFSVAYAKNILVTDNIGEACISNPTFNITGFTVAPWPIYPNQAYSFSMTGTFLSTELLDQLTIGVKRSLGSWKYTFDVINLNYLKSTTTTFTYQMSGPAEKGTYIDQITLHRPNYTIFSCWQFSYQVTN